ncbi:hypothetical protein HOK021_07650 [Streptomyces hygroscopicus]|nr:hypothetical protein HOK021_07650 [Streptomyces hygroscopicus]
MAGVASTPGVGRMINDRAPATAPVPDEAPSALPVHDDAPPVTGSPAAASPSACWGGIPGPIAGA